MASTETAVSDPLLILRRSIATNKPPIPTTTADASSAAETTDNLAAATHLQFSEPNHQSFPLNNPTRFISSDKPVDLRSIYFAWQKKDVAIPDYIASAQKLNEELAAAGGAGGSVQNLVFVERLDLITWLEGASDDSEYIKASEADASAALSSAQIASGAAGGVEVVASGAPGRRSGHPINPVLQAIYDKERRMGDRNTVLRGIKPTDFSHVRKIAESYLSRNRKAGQSTTATTSNPTNALTPNKKPNRRPDPIILLSPSASSLLRMSNIKSFLETGTYIPSDSGLTGQSSANILHISRLLPSIDPQRAHRFILVDTPEQFKPDYWSRVVAVFTTGQTWQFKSYKWQSPPELFKHALGIYVGWRGEEPPSTVKGWGRGVHSLAIDKWHAQQGLQGRWRDTEVVEGIWSAIEESMKSKGWGKDGTLPIR